MHASLKTAPPLLVQQTAFTNVLTSCVPSQTARGMMEKQKKISPSLRCVNEF